MEPDTGGADPLLAGDELEHSRLRTGAGIAVLCVLGAIGARVLIYLCGWTGVSDELAGGYLGVVMGLGVAWAAACWMMTPGSLATSGVASRGVLLAIRLSQLAWLPAFAMIAIAAWSKTGAAQEALLRGAAAAARLLAGTGALVLMWVLSEAAVRAELDDAARRLNAALWLVPITTLLVQAFPGSLPWVWQVPLGMFLAAWCWSMWQLAVGLLNLQRHVAWAAKHAANQPGRAARIEETRAEMARDLEAQIRPLPRDAGELPLAGPGLPPGDHARRASRPG